MADSLESIIRKNKPKLGDSSIKTYKSLLMKVFKTLDLKPKVKSVVEAMPDILEHYKDVAYNVRKIPCILSSWYRIQTRR